MIDPIIAVHRGRVVKRTVMELATARDLSRAPWSALRS